MRTVSCENADVWPTEKVTMRESRVTGNCHAWFGKRGRETRILQDIEVRSAPTSFSPVLANLVLDGLENKLRTRRGEQGLVNLVRYADDFIITGRTKELLETEVLPIVETHLTERGLELSPEKTKLTRIDEGFDFLGQNVRKYNGKLLIKPSKN